MKRIFSFCLLFVGLSLYAQDIQGVLDKYNTHSIPYISPLETQELLTSDKVLLLDAREREEFEVSHIPNAHYVGYRKFEKEKLSTFAPDKNSPIVVYCSIGVRSEQIAERLKQLGYVNVENLYGGIFEWVNQGLPVQDKEGKITQKVHAFSKQWGNYLKKGEKVY